MLIETEPRLALRAYEQILDLIMSGEARPGELLNERRLAEMLDMSRTPVRDALLMLEAEGLLVRVGKRGLQVKQMRIEDFMDALQVRLLLEPAVARMAVGRVPAEPLRAVGDDILALLATAEKSDRRPDRGAVRSVDDRLHGMIIDAVQNEQLAGIVRTLRRQTQIFDLRSLPERFEGTCREHLKIIEAVAEGRGDDAGEAMREHLEQVRFSIVARLTRL
jgi:DNA-binding GntR family transcriptional regulator